MGKTRVKMAIFVERENKACWPHINFDFDGEIEKIMDTVRECDPDTEFDVVRYYPGDSGKMEASYASDTEKYDGVAVVGLTCAGTDELLFYPRKAKCGGIPAILIDIPYCGTGGMIQCSAIINEEKLPTPIVMSTDYADIGKNIALFDAMRRMRESKILVITNSIESRLVEEEPASEAWGVTFVNKTVGDFLGYFDAADDGEARLVADKWIREADEVVEPTEKDIFDSAKIYLALKQMKEDENADALTVDCLDFSYSGSYNGGEHMYPCLSHFEMSRNGEIAVCEADICATITSLLTKYVTKRPGYVSDPVIDTSRGEIIYAHCVACTKVFGAGDNRTCPYRIRSHAEDGKGASVQVIFPEKEELTTTMIDVEFRMASLHSSVSCGNVETPLACRSKLAAKANTQALREKYMGRHWHRVTVFGEYRELFRNVYIMKGYRVIEEDKN